MLTLIKVKSIAKEKMILLIRQSKRATVLQDAEKSITQTKEPSKKKISKSKKISSAKKPISKKTQYRSYDNRPLYKL